jgi:hypothetical protein
LGPAHILKDPLLNERGTYFTAGGGAETYLYGAEPERLLVALRRPHAGEFGRPRQVLRQVSGSPEEDAAQSLNGRLLLTVEDGRYGHEGCRPSRSHPPECPKRRTR